jgi:hypothetical protein
MKKASRHLSCLLLLILSTAALAQNSYTARLPAAIAAGEFAEAEMLIAEGIKIGVISTTAAAAYRADIQRARENSAAGQQGKTPQTADADPEVKTNSRQSPKNKPESRPPIPLPPDKDIPPKKGRIYVTYTKLSTKTNRYYSGRTSMVIDLNRHLAEPTLDQLAQEAVRQRDRNHHIEDETPEPIDPAFTPAQVDKRAWGTAANYQLRYSDIAYLQIRGREQMLIDFFGGAWSDTGKPYKTENAKRGVAKDHKDGRRFYNAAREIWGNQLGNKEIGYTGY